MRRADFLRVGLGAGIGTQLSTARDVHTPVTFNPGVATTAVPVPAGWYLKLTVNAQAVLGTTTYH